MLFKLSVLTILHCFRCGVSFASSKELNLVLQRLEFLDSYSRWKLRAGPQPGAELATTPIQFHCASLTILLNKPYPKGVTHSEEVEWWRILMVELIL